MALGGVQVMVSAGEDANLPVNGFRIIKLEVTIQSTTE